MASTPSTARSDETIMIRPATFSDARAMSEIAYIAYAGSAVEEFLTPFGSQYPEDACRAWLQRMISRWFEPRIIGFVAYMASHPDAIVGYAQFLRLGDDAGAKQQIASRQTWLFLLQRWYYVCKFSLSNYLWPDRSVDAVNHRKFELILKIDDARHWAPFPERQSRWHVRSIVVDPKWQGKGIGSKLMSDVIRRADEEGIVIGLEASTEGEYLYRKLGFELLGRFYHDGEPIGDPDTGGIMMWKPNNFKST